MNTISKLALLFISIFIISCSDDDNSSPVIPEGDFFNGTLILNEGGSGGGSVSFLDSGVLELQNSIFEEVNEGERPGLFLQSIFFDDDKAYIIANGSNLISVVNRYTFEFMGTVDSGLSVPRYGAVHNGKAYVTNLSSFDSDQDDYIAVIDLETLEVEETVVVGAVAERIVKANGEMYIQNAAFGAGNQISKFNPATNSITSTLEVGEGLNSLQLYNQELYLLDAEGVKSINLGSFEIENQISIPESLAAVNNLRVVNNQLYYTSGTAAYSSELNASELSENIIFDYASNSAFGSFYGFEVNEDQIYVGDAGDFTSNGTIFVYSTTGELLFEDSVGIAPNSFYFQ